MPLGSRVGGAAKTGSERRTKAEAKKKRFMAAGEA
jgi:hypothetical protein